jgi:hypothetical protein
MAWPPRIGEPLPLAAEVVGVREKLVAYSLDPSHRHGGPKARGFQLILGITIADIDYLEAEIRAGILANPVRTTRPAIPSGFKCAVEIPIAGRGAKRGRIVNVRTVWLLLNSEQQPRLTTAFPKP